jgi:DNA-binding CsgD family transcriptional regulator
MDTATSFMHVDLPHTDIDDFMEHFEEAITISPERFIDGLGVPWAHQAARLDAKVREIQGLPPEPIPALPREPKVRWDKHGPDPSFDSAEFVRIDVRHGWRKRPATGQGYLISMEGQHLYLLSIVRYRRDRLRIIIAEPGTPPVHTAKILDWLKRKWGEGPDGIIELGQRAVLPAAMFLPIPTPDTSLDALTTEEASTLQLIVDGLSQKQISMLEGVGVQAIKKRQQEIAGKLEIDGPAKAEKLLSKGLELGLKRRPETIERFTPKV